MTIQKVIMNYKRRVFDAFCRRTCVWNSAFKAWEKPLHIEEFQTGFLKIS
jgi:hypothetical protein